MSGFDSWPKAMFGGTLLGDRALRFVIMDEAGISATEPVTVVVGIIVDADNQLVLTEAAVNEVLGAVPDRFKKGFVFHATDVWNNKTYRDTWSMSDRLALLRNMMTIPRRLGLTIAVGMSRLDDTSSEFAKPLGISPEQWEHYRAFMDCVGRADKFIREYGRPSEVGSIVAEDNNEMRRFLAAVPSILRKNNINTDHGGLIKSQEEEKLGYFLQESEQRVSRIRNTVHFVKKDEDLIVQIADACAFGLRRCFSGLEFGEAFAKHMIGNNFTPSDWAGPSSAAFFAFGERNK